jgi:hypothetical protein
MKKLSKKTQKTVRKPQKKTLKNPSAAISEPFLGNNDVTLNYTIKSCVKIANK